MKSKTILLFLISLFTVSCANHAGSNDSSSFIEIEGNLINKAKGLETIKEIETATLAQKSVMVKKRTVYSGVYKSASNDNKSSQIEQPVYEESLTDYSFLQYNDETFCFAIHEILDGNLVSDYYLDNLDMLVYNDSVSKVTLVEKNAQESCKNTIFLQYQTANYDPYEIRIKDDNQSLVFVYQGIDKTFSNITNHRFDSFATEKHYSEFFILDISVQNGVIISERMKASIDFLYYRLNITIEYTYVNSEDAYYIPENVSRYYNLYEGKNTSFIYKTKDIDYEEEPSIVIDDDYEYNVENVLTRYSINDYKYHRYQDILRGDDNQMIIIRDNHLHIFDYRSMEKIKEIETSVNIANASSNDGYLGLTLAIGEKIFVGIEVYSLNDYKLVYKLERNCYLSTIVNSNVFYYEIRDNKISIKRYDLLTKETFLLKEVDKTKRAYDVECLNYENVYFFRLHEEIPITSNDNYIPHCLIVGFDMQTMSVLYTHEEQLSMPKVMDQTQEYIRFVYDYAINIFSGEYFEYRVMYQDNYAHYNYKLPTSYGRCKSSSGYRLFEKVDIVSANFENIGAYYCIYDRTTDTIVARCDKTIRTMSMRKCVFLGNGYYACFENSDSQTAHYKLYIIHFE